MHAFLALLLLIIPPLPAVAKTTKFNVTQRIILMDRSTDTLVIGTEIERAEVMTSYSSVKMCKMDYLNLRLFCHHAHLKNSQESQAEKDLLLPTVIKRNSVIQGRYRIYLRKSFTKRAVSLDLWLYKRIDNHRVTMLESGDIKNSGVVYTTNRNFGPGKFDAQITITLSRHITHIKAKLLDATTGEILKYTEPNDGFVRFINLLRHKLYVVEVSARTSWFRQIFRSQKVIYRNYLNRHFKAVVRPDHFNIALGDRYDRDLFKMGKDSGSDDDHSLLFSLPHGSIMPPLNPAAEPRLTAANSLPYVAIDHQQHYRTNSLTALDEKRVRLPIDRTNEEPSDIPEISEEQRIENERVVERKARIAEKRFHKPYLTPFQRTRNMKRRR